MHPACAVPVPRPSCARRRWCAPVAAAALLAGCSGGGVVRPPAAVTPAQWQQEQLRALDRAQSLYDRAQRQPGLLAQDLWMHAARRAHRGAAFRAIFGQYLNWYDGFAGRDLRALRDFSIAQPPQPGEAPSPLLRPSVWHAQPALAAIARLARGRRAVFFNEDHTDPETRTLTIALLARLRAEGFDTFAAETLYQRGIATLRRSGWVGPGTGFYTREPLYADMVDTALALGYRVIAYEAPDAAHAQAREADEAANLARRAFRGHPHARLVVNAGFAHVQKRGRYLGGRSMAEDFMRLTGIDPLVVEQTMLTGHLQRGFDQPDWRAVIAALHPTVPIVFLDRTGRPWSLWPGAYDVSVFFPRMRVLDGRPTWLGVWGQRLPVPVSAALCAGEFPCLVSAHPAAAPRSSEALDRVVFRCGRQLRDLWLAPGRYRLRASDRADQTLGRMALQVARTAVIPAGVPLSAYRGIGCYTPGRLYRVIRDH